MLWSSIVITAFIALGIGALVGFAAQKYFINKEMRDNQKLAGKILEEARKEAAAHKKELLLQAKDETFKQKKELEREAREREKELKKQEQRLQEKEELLR